MPDPKRLTLSATESPALFDASPYLTRWMLYKKFADGIDLDKEGTSRMDWGTKMQPIILEQVAKERGLEVVPNHHYLRRGLLGCTRDATIIAPGVGPGALEIKCVFDYKVWATKWQGGDHVPREIEIQLQQQMYVGSGDHEPVEDSAAYRWGLIVVWVCADLFYFERKPIPSLWTDLERRAIRFFSDVKSKREPDPFGVPVELPLLAQMFPTVEGRELDLSNDPDHVKTSEDVSMYDHLKTSEAGRKEAVEQYRVKLLAIAKDAQFVKLPCGVSYAVRKSGKGKTIVPYIPETPTAAPPSREPLLAGG